MVNFFNNKDASKEEIDDLKELLDAYPIDGEADDINIPELKTSKDVKKFKTKIRAKQVTKAIDKILGKKEIIKSKKEELLSNIYEQDSILDKLQFWKTNKLNMGIIKRDGSLKIKTVNITSDVIELGESLYIIQIDAIIKFKGRPTLLYFDNYPFPIKFNHDEHTILVNSQDLYKLWNTRIVKGLFEVGTGLTKKQTITIGIVITVALLIYFLYNRYADSNSIFIPFMLLKYFIKNGKSIN